MLAQFLSQIAQDRRGSVAQIFALALIPVAFMAGAAIDYTRSVAERSELQVAVDAAVLAGAKDASQTWTTTSANVFKAAYKGTASAGFTKDAQAPMSAPPRPRCRRPSSASPASSRSRSAPAARPWGGTRRTPPAS